LIIGRINDLIDSHVLTEKIVSYLQLLSKMDFTSYTAGRHEIDQDLFFFLNEFETKESADCFWEAHRKNLDFHFILEGEENIAVDHITNQKVKVEYNAEKDAVFLEGDVKSVIRMTPGDVMICFPEDSHMTGILAGAKQKVRKVVLKVLI
jgi:YhcH/YjgK/YiaL family protein